MSRRDEHIELTHDNSSARFTRDNDAILQDDELIKKKDISFRTDLSLEYTNNDLIEREKRGRERERETKILSVPG